MPGKAVISWDATRTSKFSWGLASNWEALPGVKEEPETAGEVAAGAEAKAA
jgi:hypothetical protein